MVAYSYKARFVVPIRNDVKRQTIRSERKRHARPGEQLQLYCAMRSIHCRLIGTATCIDVRPISINFEALRILIPNEAIIEARADRDHFARRDGFENWTELVEFWRHERARESRKPLGIFSGVIIRWRDYVDAWDAIAA